MRGMGVYSRGWRAGRTTPRVGYLFGGGSARAVNRLPVYSSTVKVMTASLKGSDLWLRSPEPARRRGPPEKVYRLTF